ncbi:MAG: hypothetical protein QMB24_06835 [Spirosomataceae bacterium]
MKINVLILTLIGVFAAMSSFAVVLPSDTTVIEFTDKGVKKRVTVLTEGGKNFDVPKVLNLNNLLREIGVDSTERKKAMVMVEGDDGKKDTILVIARDGRTIKIVARNPFPEQATEADDRWTINQKDSARKEDDDYVQRLGKKRFFSKSDFGIYLGLNGWQNNNPASPNQLTDLRTGRSRYVALSFRKNATLLNTEQVDIALSLGPEIAWYNFMLQNDNIVTNVGDQVTFLEGNQQLPKSKLVMPYINLPILLNFGFEESQFQIGVGGYVGYRFGGYSKTKDANGNKTRLKDDYGMNDLFYGLTGELGRRRGLKLFVRYDLNPMFRDNQINANKLQAWSIGIRI